MHLYLQNKHSICLFFSIAVPPSYISVFNATQYEFDIDVHSPIGTVVFKIQVFFQLCQSLEVDANVPHSPNFNFNGKLLVTTNASSDGDYEPTWSITLEKPLNPDDNIIKYQFQLVATAHHCAEGSHTHLADVILYERRK